MTFTIEELTQKHVDAASECLAKSFAREPMIKCQGISWQTVRDNFVHVVKKSANDGLSLVTIEQSSGKIAGVTINMDMTSEPADADVTFDECLNPVFALLETLDTSVSDFEGCKAGEFFHSFMLAVDEKYSGNNLGTLQTQATFDVAIKNGYKTLVLEATGPVSQHVCATKLNCKVISVINYSEFEFEGKKVFAGLGKDLTCQLMVKSLD
jgi:hypothetical protein